MDEKSNGSLNSLRRYTRLPALLHLLRKREITLLSPTSWADRNDSYYLEQFKARQKAKTVLAICLSEASETYHHWKIFTEGSDSGVCIQFDRDRLLEAFPAKTNVRHGAVEYVELNKATVPALDRLPFLKRFPYRDEREYRFVYADANREVETKSFKIPLGCIEKITLSPWLHKDLAEIVRETVQSVDGCNEITITRTTLLENKRWQNLARQDVE